MKDRERFKEYSYPPLPNLVTAKKAYLKQKADNQNYSLILDKAEDFEKLGVSVDNNNLNVSAPDIVVEDQSFTYLDTLNHPGSIKLLSNDNAE